MKTKQPGIFMVEDDRNFGAVLKSYLELHDFIVDWVEDGAEALQTWQAGKYDICVLDIMLPNVDGFGIATQIRKLDPVIPLIFLTAKTLKKDVLHGFKLGADDYITKPFDSEVLICKINAILKRNTRQADNGKHNSFSFRIGDYLFDSRKRIISYKGDEEKLSPKESELLKMLCLHENNILPRDHALEKIWGEQTYFTTRSMDVFISKLRKMLSRDPRLGIINVHGSGYRLEVGDES